MKKFTATLAIFMLAFTLSFLVACGGNGGGGNEVTPPPTVDNGGAQDPVVTPPDGDQPPQIGLQIGAGAGVHEVRDFGGRTLTIGAWWADPIGPWLFGPAPTPDTLNYSIVRAMWDNARRVEQEFNVNFAQVTVTHEEFLPTLASSVLAGDPFADVVYLEGWMMLEAMGSIVQSMNVNLPASDMLGAQRFSGPTTQDEIGNIWAVNPHSVIDNAFVLAVNLDIINAEGLPNPVELYEAGQWTWDAMLQIMRGATRDTDGDGVVDQFGIAGQPGDIVQHLIGANDGIMVDAYFNYGFTHPNTVRALEFVEQIFQEQLWHSEEGGVMNTANWDRNFYAGNREARAALFPTRTWGIDNAPPAFEFAVVPFPMGPDNTSGNTWLYGMRQGISVPVGTPWAVEDIVVILDELFSWPGEHPELLFAAGSIDWMRETFLTEDDVQRAVRAGLTAASDVGRDMQPYYWILGMFASAFFNMEMDVMQAIEYFRGPHQEMLDRRFRP
ncbi:MAG: extracellular solute-binding protein [Defluviitaleaceae bacterium]|nr:extracellular solute-binding protein [Defluviitaleaceae bacterium]MCL2263300.1 extracellular solute-binding protein [Defluviitaleaceae bacterium]